MMNDTIVMDCHVLRIFRAREYYRQREGHAFLVAVILTAIISLTVAFALRFSLHERRLSHHSAAWAQALHVAEAGVEVGLNELYKELLDGNGFGAPWAIISNGIYGLLPTPLAPSNHPPSDSDYSVLVDTNTHTISTVGRVHLVSLDQLLVRKLEVVAKPDFGTPYAYAILTKSLITLQGNADIDSFDSTDPTKSTNGQFDPSKQQTNATVVSLSTNDPAIDAKTGNLYGDMLTGPDGTVSIGVSFTQHGSSIDNGIQTDIADVVVPFSTVFTDLPINGNTTIPVAAAPHDMSVPSITLNGAKVLTITGEGTLRLYVDGPITFTGSSKFLIVSNPSNAVLNVEIYANADVTLNSVVNASGQAANLTFYGTPNCSQIEFHGNDPFVATLYAPSASYIHNGTGEYIGALVANDVQYLGDADFHYDESLGTISLPFLAGLDIVRWTEL